MSWVMRSMLGAIAFLLVPLSALAQTVDVQLIVAADVSLSVQGPLFLMERHGLSSALMEPETASAIKAGPHGSIAICFVEWANESQQKVIVDWTILRDEGDITGFAVNLLTAPRSFSGYASISGAIDFAVKHFKESEITASRRVVTIVADGTNASGRSVTAARDAAIAAGVTVDGIAIRNLAPKWKHIEHTSPEEGLEEYFRANVIGGSGAFVTVLDDAAPPSAGDLIAGHLERVVRGRP